ncbi:MAG TPA: hypothetical protein VHO71_00930 [Caproiciproducens sp.]|nr:hypothetical protein [Caproiciproducens sp.]
MSMTVDSIASLYNQESSFTSSDAYRQNAVDEPALTKEEYGVSDLTAALSTLSRSGNVNLNLTNVSQYAQNTIAESQLSEYETLSELESGVKFGGTIDSSVQLSSLLNQVNANAGSIDLNGITDLGTYTEIQTLSYKLTQGDTYSALTAYQSSLGDNLTGNLLNSSV